jgi:hypothetical protein
MARCLFDYEAENPKELGFSAGDIISILTQVLYLPSVLSELRKRFSLSLSL